MNISAGDDPEADTHEDEINDANKAEICPSCESSVALVETEDVIGNIVGIYECKENKHQYRKPLSIVREKVTWHRD